MSNDTRKENVGNVSSEIRHVQEAEDWNGLSFILHIFLPMAGLAFLFNQKHIFSRLLLQLDRNCVSVFCPSFSRREKLLKWAGERLPDTWSSHSRTLSGGVAELWSDGSLLCTLINSAIPGACPNPHRHWRKPPLHAQALAYKYLGVLPIFTENDLSLKLTVHLERNFLCYLDELQKAIVKQTERSEVTRSISNYYIPRGMGLYSGEQHRKTVFYVYANMKNIRGINSNIIIHIRGPYGTYGKAVIPKFYNELFTIPEINVTSDSLKTRTLFKKNCKVARNSFMRNVSLPFMQYHKKHLGDNIVIDVKMEEDRAKVTYIPKNYGMYEINMISNGELIKGCPFDVHIFNNTSGIEDSFENEEKEKDIPNIKKRKIISKTIDFVDEQMPIADLLRIRYKDKEGQKNKNENEINLCPESGEYKLNYKDNPLSTTQLVDKGYTNIFKFDVLPKNTFEENINKKNHELNTQQDSYHKKEIFKLRHNEKTIDEEKDDLNFQVDDMAESEPNFSDECFNNLENQNTEFDYKGHDCISIDENQILNETEEENSSNILDKQNTEFITENSILQDVSKSVPEINNDNVMDDNDHLNVLSVPDNHKSTFQVDDKVMSKITINDVSKDEHLDKVEKEYSEYVNENYISSLNDRNKIISKTNIYKNVADGEHLNILESQSVDSITENQELNSSDKEDSTSKTNYNVPNVRGDDPFHILEKENSNTDNVKYTSDSFATDEYKKQLERLLNENNKQRQDKICKVNDFADKISTHAKVNKKNLRSSNLSSSKTEIAPTTISNKKLIDVQNQQQLNIDNDSVLETGLIQNESPLKLSINKIKIPEKFCYNQDFSKTNMVTGLDTKYFKNVVNSSNKRDSHERKSTILLEDKIVRVTKTKRSEYTSPKIDAQLINENKTENDNDDNNNKDIENLEHNEVKQNLFKALSRKNSTTNIEKVNIVPKRFFQTQVPSKTIPKPTSLSIRIPNGTSPICPDHIVPEVEHEFTQMSVAEKRKIFSKQPSVKISDSSNSSFSENENAEGSKNLRHFRQFEGLSVLNYLGSLKQSQNARNPENYCLCNTTSLPNINSIDSDYIFHNSVKARKHFWEQMSSSSSSLNTNFEVSPRRNTEKLTETERCRLIWKKPHEEDVYTNVDSEDMSDLEHIYKSADDILSRTNIIPYENPKMYKSLDNSLDNCTMLSIEERKKMLLKQNYESEKRETNKLNSFGKNNIKKSCVKKIFEEKNEENKNGTIFSPILDKIKKYDNALNLANSTKQEEINVSKNSRNDSEDDISKNYIHNDLQNIPQSQKVTIKSHFKRAISYFKNLEEKSLGKYKSKSTRTDCRRYSLNIQPNKNKNNKRGGSLNLPNISERFSINNLYEDVFGNKKGNFKGAVNQSALVEALATFSRKENNLFNEEDEDDIRYNIFKRKAKSKKRRSVRSIFDVYY